MKWTSQTLKTAIRKTFLQILTMSCLSFTYLFLRAYMQFLSINPLLFQDTISPFYKFEGGRRFWNYSMVTAIHVLKGVFLDPIGVAHEYAFDCVHELNGITDIRYVLLVTVLVGFGTAGLYTIRRNLCWKLHFLVILSWFATLFPITGIITTGTFIADRLVVPCTIASSIYLSKAVVHIAVGQSKFQKFSVISRPLIVLYLAFLSNGTFKLIKSWTTRPGMLRMTLESCPNNAKAILEMGMLKLQPEYGTKDPSMAM